MSDLMEHLIDAAEDRRYSDAYIGSIVRAQVLTELKALAASEQKHAALAEAVRSWNEQRIACEVDELPRHRSQERLRLLYLRDRMIALAQQDRPAPKHPLKSIETIANVIDPPQSD